MCYFLPMTKRIPIFPKTIQIKGPMQDAIEHMAQFFGVSESMLLRYCFFLMAERMEIFCPEPKKLMEPIADDFGKIGARLDEIVRI